MNAWPKNPKGRVRGGYLPRRRSREGFVCVGDYHKSLTQVPYPSQPLSLNYLHHIEARKCTVMYNNSIAWLTMTTHFGDDSQFWSKSCFFPSIIQCSDRMLPRQAQSSSQLLGISLWCLQILACVASVSNRVTARKLEREQKKRPPPPPSFLFFFFLLSSQLSRRTREETLATQAIKYRNVSKLMDYRGW